MRRFDGLVDLDEVSRIATLGAGVTGPRAEELLGEHGLSLGHFPQSFRFATVGGESLSKLINDDAWNRDTFIPTVGKRGAAIIEARGLSSAASAANAAIDHVRDWVLGSNGKWVTMGIPSDGQYGIPKDVMFGFPVTCENGEYKLVEGLEIDAFSQERINKTLKELQDEQAGVANLL